MYSVLIISCFRKSVNRCAWAQILTKCENLLVQEIRRERRSELALQGFRLDDILRWRGHEVLAGRRGRGAYFGNDGVLYRSFNRNDAAGQEIREAKIEVTKSLDPLISAIRRVTEFYASRNAGEEVDRIIVTGFGGAMSAHAASCPKWSWCRF